MTREFLDVPKILYELSGIASKAFGGKTKWHGLEDLKKFEIDAISDSSISF